MKIKGFWDRKKNQIEHGGVPSIIKEVAAADNGEAALASWKEVQISVRWCAPSDWTRHSGGPSGRRYWGRIAFPHCDTTSKLS